MLVKSSNVLIAKKSLGTTALSHHSNFNPCRCKGFDVD